GLDAVENNEVALRRTVVVEGVRRPVDAAFLTLPAYGGAQLREVVEVLCLELRELRGVPAVYEVLGRSRRRAAGVGPAGEGSNHDRVSQLRYVDRPKGAHAVASLAASLATFVVLSILARASRPPG